MGHIWLCDWKCTHVFRFTICSFIIIIVKGSYKCLIASINLKQVFKQWKSIQQN